MTSKILLILGAALAVLALALLVLPTPEPVPPVDEDPGELIDAGHFVLEQAGERLLDEAYTLFYHPVDGHMLLSQSTLTVGGNSAQLSQQTQYDRELLPVFYHLAAETAAGTQIVAAQMGLSGLEMEVRVGLARQAVTVSDTEDIALLDNNLIGHYVILLMAIRDERLDRAFTAAIPQALLSLPARVEGPNTVTFRSGGATVEGRRFDLHLGDTAISLIEHDGRLVGLLNASQGTVGYDVDLFPDGIEIEEEPEAEAAGIVEREIAFESDGLTLRGTIAGPDDGDAIEPAVVFIHGSGPVDRDGNAAGMTMDAYRQIAHALARAGIASLRFDKRGVGESEGEAALASRADLLADVNAAVDAVQGEDGLGAESVVLIGHSEGSYLAPVVAAENDAVAGVVLLSGAARPLDEITKWQIETLLQHQGVEGPQLDALLAQQDQYIAFVEASQGEWSDYTVEMLQEAMPWMTEDSAQQLLATPLALSWLREHYLDEPADAIRQLDVPVLILSGEKDSQVPASEAELIRQLLDEAGNPDVTALVLEDLNHLLRYHPEEPNLTYRHLDEPVDARVTETIVEWILARWGG